MSIVGRYAGVTIRQNIRLSTYRPGAGESGRSEFEMILRMSEREINIERRQGNVTYEQYALLNPPGRVGLLKSPGTNTPQCVRR